MLRCILWSSALLTAALAVCFGRQLLLAGLAITLAITSGHYK